MNRRQQTDYRLWLDLQAVQGLHAPERGIARYSLELTRALRAKGAPIGGIGLNPVLSVPDSLPADIARAGELAWTTAQAFRAVADHGPVIYHALSPFEFVSPPEVLFPPFVRNGHALAVTLYDLIPYVFPEFYQGSPELRALYRARRETVRRADLFLVLSHHSKRDLIDLFEVDEAQCHVIGGGASPFFRVAEDPEEPRRVLGENIPALSRPFVLAVGGCEWRKNNETLIEAYAQLPPATRNGYQLVIVGNVPSEAAIAWRRFSGRIGLAPQDLILAGRVHDLTLRALYQSASLLVFPTRYEGFGLPIVEAGRCGCPVLASNASSIREVLDSSEATFPPDDVSTLASSMRRALEDETFRERLRSAAVESAAQHTWEVVAERALTAYSSLSAPLRHRSRTVTRVAFVGLRAETHLRASCFPRRLLDSIGPRLEIDCFVDTIRDRHQLPPRRVFPIEQFGRMFRPEHYDTVVYAIGDGPLAARVAQLASAYPGVAWLLDGLPSELPTNGRQDDGESHSEFDGIGESSQHGDGDHGNGALGSVGHPSTSEILSASPHVIASSESALRWLRLGIGPFFRTPCSSAIPGPIPTAEDLGTDRIPGKPPGIATVLSWDALHPSACPELLIDSIAVCSREASVRLVLVGAADPEIRSRLIARADSLGVVERVSFVGFPKATEVGSLLATATCVVQLDMSGRGRGVTAVARALAVGRPVISDILPWKDLPGVAVDHVPTGINADELARRIVPLVIDDDEWRCRHKDALAFASRWTLEKAVDRFLRVIRDVSIGSARTPQLPRVLAR